MHNRSHPSVRPTFLAVSVIAATVALTVWGAAQNGAPPASAKPQTARQRFKNIKVLKNLPADQLIPYMQAYSASLGVRCGFCHVGRDFEKDDKPEKNVARQMIVMTQRLNAREKIIDKKATCYMCHHGNATPQTQAPPPGPPPGAGGPPSGPR
jgi:photosynthetic reaction center cytochrome c subunit